VLVWIKRQLKQQTIEPSEEIDRIPLQDIQRQLQEEELQRFGRDFDTLRSHQDKEDLYATFGYIIAKRIQPNLTFAQYLIQKRGRTPYPSFIGNASTIASDEAGHSVIIGNDIANILRDSYRDNNLEEQRIPRSPEEIRIYTPSEASRIINIDNDQVSIRSIDRIRDSQIETPRQSHIQIKQHDLDLKEYSDRLRNLRNPSGPLHELPGLQNDRPRSNIHALATLPTEEWVTEDEA
jgi:alpha-N-acetylglucosamine transferase